MTRTSYLPDGAAAQGWSVHPYESHAGRRAGDRHRRDGAGRPGVGDDHGPRDATRPSCSTVTPTCCRPTSSRGPSARSRATRRTASATRTGWASSCFPGGSGTLAGHTGSMPGFLATCLVDREPAHRRRRARQRDGRLLAGRGRDRAARRARALRADGRPAVDAVGRRCRPSSPACPGVWHWGNTAVRLRDGGRRAGRRGATASSSTASRSSTAAWSACPATTPARSCTSYAAPTARSATSTSRRSSTPGRRTTRTPPSRADIRVAERPSRAGRPSTSSRRRRPCW